MAKDKGPNWDGMKSTNSSPKGATDFSGVSDTADETPLPPKVRESPSVNQPGLNPVPADDDLLNILDGLDGNGDGMPSQRELDAMTRQMADQLVNDLEPADGVSVPPPQSAIAPGFDAAQAPESPRPPPADAMLDLPDGDLFGTTADAYQLLTANQRRGLRDNFSGDLPPADILAEIDVDLGIQDAEDFDGDEAPPALAGLLRQLAPDVQRRAVSQPQPLNSIRNINDLYPKLNRTPREMRQEEASEVARDPVDIRAFEVEDREDTNNRRRVRSAQGEEADLQKDLDKRLQELITIGEAGQDGDIDLTAEDLSSLGAEYERDRERLGASIGRERGLLGQESEGGTNRRRQREIDKRLGVLDKAEKRLMGGRGDVDDKAADDKPETRDEQLARRRAARGDRDADAPAEGEAEARSENDTDVNGPPQSGQAERAGEERGAPAEPGAGKPDGGKDGKDREESSARLLQQMAEDYASGKLAEEVAAIVTEKLRQQ